MSLRLDEKRLYMKKIILTGAVVSLMLCGTACKPTEKNYKAAYDVAQQKRKAEATDPDMVLPAGGLQRLDAPRKQIIDGDSVYVITSRLKFTGGLENQMHKWNVAVASYRMPTNCAAQVSDLFSKGYKSFSAESPDGNFYVIAASFDTLKEAAAFAKEYNVGKKPEVYVGLPGAPLIIEK